jgi:hypothetical protein
MNMISQRAYALVIIMTAVTTVLPPPLLKLLFAPGNADTGVAAGEETEVQVSGQLG